MFPNRSVQKNMRLLRYFVVQVCILAGASLGLVWGSKLVRYVCLFVCLICLLVCLICLGLDLLMVAFWFLLYLFLPFFRLIVYVN